MKELIISKIKSHNEKLCINIDNYKKNKYLKGIYIENIAEKIINAVDEDLKDNFFNIDISLMSNFVLNHQSYILKVGYNFQGEIAYYPLKAAEDVIFPFIVQWNSKLLILNKDKNENVYIENKTFKSLTDFKLLESEILNIEDKEENLKIDLRIYKFLQDIKIEDIFLVTRKGKNKIEVINKKERNLFTLFINKNEIFNLQNETIFDMEVQLNINDNQFKCKLPICNKKLNFSDQFEIIHSKNIYNFKLYITKDGNIAIHRKQIEIKPYILIDKDNDFTLLDNLLHRSVTITGVNFVNKKINNKLVLVNKLIDEEIDIILEDNTMKIPIEMNKQQVSKNWELKLKLEYENEKVYFPVIINDIKNLNNIISSDYIDIEYHKSKTIFKINNNKVSLTNVNGVLNYYHNKINIRIDAIEKEIYKVVVYNIKTKSYIEIPFIIEDNNINLLFEECIVNKIAPGDYKLYIVIKEGLGEQLINVSLDDEEREFIEIKYLVDKDNVKVLTLNQENKDDLILNVVYDKKDILYKNYLINLYENNSKYEKNLSLAIECECNLQYSNTIKDIEIYIKNRKTLTEIPLRITSYGDKKILNFDYKDIDLEEMKGIWDIFTRVEIKGVSYTERFKVFNNEIFIPINIMNRYGKIITVRLYKTLDNNGAVYINDKYSINGNIESVSSDEQLYIIEGSLAFNLEYRDLHIEAFKIFNEKQKILLEDFKIEKTSETHIDYQIKINKKSISKIAEGNYSITCVFKYRNINSEIEIKSNSDDINNKNNMIMYEEKVDDNIYSHLFIFDKFNNLNLQIKNNINILLKKINIKNNRYRLSCELYCDEDPLLISENNNFNLFIVNDQEHEQVKISDYKFNNNVLSFSIAKDSFTSSIENKKGYIYLGFNYLNNILLSPVVCEENLNDFSTFREGILKLHGNLYTSIFVCSKTKKINFECRELFDYEKNNKIVAYEFIKIFSELFKKRKKEIWLISENLGEVAQDNGLAFFEYCINNKVKQEVYYVTKKDNKHMDKLIKYKDHLIYYDTLKHKIYYNLAKYAIVSHGLRDVMPSVIHNRISSNSKPIIYLQHGIIAMKKLNFNKNSYNGKIKKFVVSSENEENILLKQMGFKKKQLMITGLSRFDKLEDKSQNSSSKQIVIMPTWRDWLMYSEKDFMDSKFYENYMGLLSDEKLIDMLEKNNIKLKFIPHIEIQKKYLHLFNFKSNNVELVDLSNESIQQLIRESNLLITDYSSVVFDFNYLKKPSIFYHFDVDEYLKYRGSYVSFESDLVGEVTKDKEELIDKIEFYINSNFKYEEKFHEKSKKYYKYRDKKNSERIYKEIIKLK